MPMGLTVAKMINDKQAQAAIRRSECSMMGTIQILCGAAISGW
jgi:hypothetical protein